MAKREDLGTIERLVHAEHLVETMNDENRALREQVATLTAERDEWKSLAIKGTDNSDHGVRLLRESVRGLELAAQREAVLREGLDQVEQVDTDYAQGTDANMEVARGIARDTLARADAVGKEKK